EGMRCADTVEVDIRQTRDGVLVIMHDATLDRTTNGHGLVRTCTMAALQRLDAGEGEKIPTFREVLDLVGGRCGLFAEIKEPGTEDPVCTLIHEAGIRDVTVVSFHASAIRRVKEYADIRTGLIVSGTNAGTVDFALDLGANVLLPEFSMVTPALVTEAHREYLSLVAWTVNDDAEIRRALDLEIDGIATDNPCHARYVIDHC
ncbi:MAG: glycerophosphodiester phosphodiesterase, partial [Methanoregulaceae archaeon]|nr:glycerophosphodiester phosphodiesterase [Methanoregulaceae archaeon]